MSNSKLVLRIFIVILFFSTANYLKAQYIIEQIEYEIPISYELIPEDAEFEGLIDEINFILNIEESKLKDAALAEGRDIKYKKITMYIDGENFAVEMESEDNGKESEIFDTKNNRIYYVLWAQKKVFEMTPEDMKKMEEESKAATEEMMANLSAEMRAQVESEMEKEKNNFPIKYNAQPTGKKMKLYGFNCEEYRVTKGEEVIAIWSTSDEKGIVKEVSRVFKKFDDLFNTGDNVDIDEWQLVPDKIPIQVRMYSYSMEIDEPVLLIQTITKIENKNPSVDKFKVPGEKEGFTKGSMMDMMMQMMPGDK